MHPLNNGSQVENVPALKPRVGIAGYFSESDDNGAPSYPGQDWFNAVIREFQGVLSTNGVAFDPDKFDHLARAFDAVRSQQWLALINYDIGMEVLFSGKRYYAVQPSGPDNGGEQQPSPSSVEYWFEVPNIGTREFEFLSVPVGEEVAFDSSPPIDDPRFRFVKLTYNDAYNTGLLTSQTLSGTTPELVSTAVISAAQSPINGQTIDMINTMGTFIRPGVTAGVRKSSQNKAHTHTQTIFGGNDFSIGDLPVATDDAPGGTRTSAYINNSGGDEANPYCISRIIYKRIY